MNEFYGIHCYYTIEGRKSLTCHGEVADFHLSRGCHGLVADLSLTYRGRHGEAGIMEFGLYQVYANFILHVIYLRRLAK